MQQKPGGLEVGGVSASSALPEAQMKRTRRRRTDWRLGGRAVSKWDSQVLVIAFVGAGFGIILARVVAGLAIPGASLLSLAALWAGLLIAVVFAVVRSRPAGLFRFRAVDLLWGVGLGLGSRLLQGLLSGANSLAFPSTTSTGRSLHEWIIGEAVPAGFVAPVIEEAFFRAVVFVTVYQLLRRSSGSLAAAGAAALSSTGLFVCLHALFGSVTLVDSLSLVAVSLSCAGMVMLTGRLWGAVVVHSVYNLSMLLLVYAGSVLQPGL